MEGIKTTVSTGFRDFEAVHVSEWHGYEIAYLWGRLVMTEPINCGICAECDRVILQIIRDDRRATEEVRAFLAGVSARD